MRLEKNTEWIKSLIFVQKDDYSTNDRLRGNENYRSKKCGKWTRIKFRFILIKCNYFDNKITYLKEEEEEQRIG